MDDLLPRDFVYRSQAKAAPMAASKSTTTTTPLNFGIGSDSEIGRSSSSSRVRSSSGWNSASFLDDQDSIFGSKPSTGYDDVFGGPPKYSSSKPSASPSSFDYDSFFQKDTKAPTPSSPVYDKPVYDDEMDIFDGVQGVKSSSKFDDVFTINSPPKRNEKSSRYEDVFSGVSSPPKQKDDYDDLLGNFGRKVSESSSSRKKSGDMDKEKKMSSFDDLLPGFGGSSPNNRSTPEASGPQQPTVPRTKSPSSIIEDPFVVLESAPGPAYASSGLFTESLEPTDRPRKSGSTNSDVPSARRGLNDDMDPLGDLGKSVPKFSSDTNNRAKDRNSSRTGINMTSTHHSVGEEQTGRTFVETDEIVSRRKAPTEDYRDSHQTLFDMPTVSSDSNKAFDRNGSRSYVTSPGTNSQFSPKFKDNSGASDDVWLTVSEIPLFTQPTSAPQPSRPPPPRPTQGSRTVKGPFSASNSKKVNEFSSYESISQTSRRPEPVSESAKSSGMSSMDELEEFAKAKRRSNADELGDSLSSEEEIETNSTAATSAAAMKKAVDLAEAKFKHAREVRERENAKGAKTRGQQEREEKVMPDVQERELREKQERLDREREQREREEKESEQRKLEKERERARELEKEKNRQAVERATKEARERAATEARLKAERAQAEKAKAEALERSQRQAVQRAHAEARKRLAAEAREKAERAAAEARERAAAEARERANAEAREKANAEAREKANAEARRRADKPTATAEPRAGRGSQKNENDLESFFGGMANRPSSAPKGRTTSTDSTPQFHTRTGPEGSQGPSSAGTSSGINRTFSTPNIVDDLTSIFGGMPSSGDFQDIEGETEERRRARLERHQRTQDRAKLALAAKNDRDLKAQREQEERHRISETLDVEIKRWAAGKEGNLRALLSTLQYVLWKECGWQAVSLTDLITGASVKKVYRKATLCIHPDKVQQKGANLQQKYIAEKVFDLLKEAWNKFNSEELF